MQIITNTSVIDDKLGFDQIYIQAKKWDSNGSVSRPEIQKFAGALWNRVEALCTNEGVMTHHRGKGLYVGCE